MKEKFSKKQIEEVLIEIDEMVNRQRDDFLPGRAKHTLAVLNYIINDVVFLDKREVMLHTTIRKTEGDNDNISTMFNLVLQIPQTISLSTETVEFLEQDYEHMLIDTLKWAFIAYLERKFTKKEEAGEA